MCVWQSFRKQWRSVKQIRQILVLLELRFSTVGERDRRSTPSPEDVLERKTMTVINDDGKPVRKAQHFLSTLRGWCLSRQLQRCMARTRWATHRGRAILILQRNRQETRGAYKAWIGLGRVGETIENGAKKPIQVWFSLFFLMNSASTGGTQNT